MSFLFKATFSWRAQSSRSETAFLGCRIWCPAIHQARKLEIPRATDSSYGKWRASKTRRYVLSVRQQKLTDNTFPKSSGRPH
jgi:hypothetical protein